MEPWCAPERMTHPLHVCPTQMRWFSFHFLMQQLGEELADAHTAVQLVLAALPKPPKRGRRPPEPAREPLLPQ